MFRHGTWQRSHDFIHLHFVVRSIFGYNRHLPVLEDHCRPNCSRFLLRDSTLVIMLKRQSPPWCLTLPIEPPNQYRRTKSEICNASKFPTFHVLLSFPQSLSEAFFVLPSASSSPSPSFFAHRQTALLFAQPVKVHANERREFALLD